MKICTAIVLIMLMGLSTFPKNVTNLSDQFQLNEIKPEIINYRNNWLNNESDYILSKVYEGRKLLAEAKYVDAVEAFTDLLKLAEAANDSVMISTAYTYLCLTNGLVGNSQASLSFAKLANSFLSTKSDKRLNQWAKVGLGSAHYLNNNYSLADSILTDIVNTCDSLNYDNQYLIYAYQYLAAIRINEGKFEYAKEILEKAIEYPSTHHTIALISCLYQLGHIHSNMSNTITAHQYYQRAHNLAVKEPDKSILAKIYTHKARYFNNNGDYKRSAHFYSLTDSLYEHVVNAKISQEVHLVTINQQRESEIKQLEIRRQQAEIETLNLEKKSARLSSVIFMLLFVLSISWSLLILLKKKRAQRVAKLEQEVSKAKDKALENYIIGQEEERNRLARDLHDGIGSQLAMLKMQLSRYASVCSYAHQSISLCDEIYHGLRDVAFNLMPRPLVREGLISATKELCKKLNKSTEIEFAFSSYGAFQRLESNLESALFRITQEITANIVKHSKAQKAQIDFMCDQRGIGLTITWDGKGFDPEKLKKSDGNGWRNINTRLSQLEGNIYLDTSEDHQHSSVLVEIPLKNMRHYGKTG